MNRVKFAWVLAFLTALGIAQAHPNHPPTHQPPWQEATDWPDRIIVTLPEDPATSFAVTWRTDETVGVAIAEIAVATPDARFDLGATTKRARTERVYLTYIDGPDGRGDVLENQGLPAVHYHSVTFSDLLPDTLYAYRVRGAWGQWSAWRQVRTAPTTGPVRFVFFGDAQTGIRSHVTRIFDTAAQIAHDANFVVHGGDLVNTAFYDREWAEWFAAFGVTAKRLPSIPVTGNHDYVNFDKDLGRQEGKLFVARKSVSPLWRPQFALPVSDSLPADLAETVYDVRYTEDVHLFVLDSSGVAWDDQLAWLSDGLEESDAKWRIVTMHHPMFSFIGGREHPAHEERRLALARVLERQDIDLVLTGHRHSYQRGRFGDDVARFAVGTPQNVDTMFVITASSTKRGESKVDGWARFREEEGGDVALSRYGDNTPLFAVITIDGDQLTLDAVDATGSVYDSFTLEKDADGAKTLVDAPVASTEPRTYGNTGPYRAWDDLR